MLDEFNRKRIPSNWLSQSLRTNIIDFHVPSQVRIGTTFQGREFGERLREMGCQAIAPFCKCHYGYNYYPTEIGPTHPGLDFDLFGAQLEACQSQGIRVMAYYSLARDSAAWEARPSWRMIDSKGEPVRTVRGDWGVVCFNSPYVEELVWPQIREILHKYPTVDGMWWDIVEFAADSCYCLYCREQMRMEGVDPADSQAHHRFKERSIVRFLEQAKKICEAIKPDLLFTVNSTGRVGRARRCQTYTDLLLTEYVPFRQGFLYWVPYAHHMRSLDRPFNATMSRFHKGWGDMGSMKSDAQLQYEVAQVLSCGGTCLFVDQFGPDLKIWPAVVQQVQKAYSFIETREKWCTEARAVSEIAILADSPSGGPQDERSWNAVQGACKALKESHFLFDVIDEGADFDDYRLLLLADHCRLGTQTCERLREYVQGGGLLLATFWASLLPAGSESDPCFLLEDVFGASYKGLSPYTRHYLQLDDPLVRGQLPEQVWVIYDRALQVAPLPASRVMAQYQTPLFDTDGSLAYSHSQAPPSPHAPVWPAAIVYNRCGEGACVYCNVPIFRTFWENNTPQYRHIVENLLNHLLQGRRMVEVDAGPSVDVSLMVQSDRFILHLINYHAERRAVLPLLMDQDDILNRGAVTPYPQPPESYDRLPSHEVIEEIPPRYDIGVRVRLPRPPSRAYFAPSLAQLPYRQEAGVYHFVVPELRIHEMAVFEYD